MSLMYRIMYRVGFTPWVTGDVAAELAALVSGGEALAPGDALDIGCGTGTQAVYLATHGWRVTGIDAVERPLREARKRSAAAGATVQWLQADVTRLEQAGLTPGFSLLHDRGCYHGLSAQARTAYARGTTALAAPGAILLLMSFAPNRVIAGPSGADREEIMTRFQPAWELSSEAPDRASAPAGPLRNVPRTWYQLRKR